MCALRVKCLGGVCEVSVQESAADHVDGIYRDSLRAPRAGHKHHCRCAHPVYTSCMVLVTSITVGVLPVS